MSTVPRRSRLSTLTPQGRLAQQRVASIEADFEVPLHYFDYDKWDKLSKPASFNLKVPRHLTEDAQRQSVASSLRVTIPTRVFNGRRVIDSLNLDVSGFYFGCSPTVMRGTDFYDVQVIHDTYFKECAEFVKTRTGATVVLPFDHSVRNSSKMYDGSGVGGYANTAHNDNTAWSGPRRARQLLKENGYVEEILAHRFAVMNVWRRWDGGNDWPLAICAGDSLAPDGSDLVGTDLVYRNRTGEIYNAIQNPSHTFFWFPDMSSNEAIILKIYDRCVVPAALNCE